MITLSKKELDWLAKNGSGRMKKFAEVNSKAVAGEQKLGIDGDRLSVLAGSQRVSSLAPSNYTPSIEDLEEDLGYTPETL